MPKEPKAPFVTRLVCALAKPTLLGKLAMLASLDSMDSLIVKLVNATQKVQKMQQLVMLPVANVLAKQISLEINVTDVLRVTT